MSHIGIEILGNAPIKYGKKTKSKFENCLLNFEQHLKILNK